MADVTFRDFAFAAMQKQTDAAIGHLQTLLGLAAEPARAATEYFQQRVSDPAFMPKAMALRTAVESGSDEQIGAVLGECFALDDAQRALAVATLRTRYPKPA